MIELTNRQNKRGGGVCLYVDEKINYKMRNDLNEIKHPEYTESLFIEIEPIKSKTIIVGVMYIYRPPDRDIKEFNNFADSLLSKITKKKKKKRKKEKKRKEKKRKEKLVYIIGDFDVNLLNEDIHIPTSDFITFSSYSLYPSITKPTRITTKSAILINNIFTNSHTNRHLESYCMT